MILQVSFLEFASKRSWSLKVRVKVQHLEQFLNKVKSHDYLTIYILCSELWFWTQRRKVETTHLCFSCVQTTNSQWYLYRSCISLKWKIEKLKISISKSTQTMIVVKILFKKYIHQIKNGIKIHYGVIKFIQKVWWINVV